MLKLKTILNKFTSLTALALILFSSIILTPKTQAKFVPLECISGSCNLDAQIDDIDLIKVFPRTFPGVRFRLDIGSLRDSNNPSNTFRVIMYEKESENDPVKVLTSTNIRFPNKSRNFDNFAILMQFRPFSGQRQMFLDVYSSAGQLNSSYKFTLIATGSFVPNQSRSKGALFGTDATVGTTTSLNCATSQFDDCNLDNLFFNKVIFESDTVIDTNYSLTKKDNDDAIRVRIPIAASRLPRPFFGSTVVTPTFVNTGFPDSPNPNPGNTNTQIDNVTAVNRLNLGQPEVNSFYINGNGKLESQFQLTGTTPLIFTENGLGNNPATLIEAGANNLPEDSVPALALNQGVLATTPVDGSVEFDGTNLYFTSGGERKFIILDENNQNGGTSTTVPTVDASVPNSDDAAALGGNQPAFFTSADNFNAGTLDSARLPAGYGENIDILLNGGSTSNGLTLAGANNIEMTANGSDAKTYTLPTTGKLATDALIPIANINQVTSVQIQDDNLLAVDFADNSVTNNNLLSVNPEQITEGTFDASLLPARGIDNVIGLADALNSKLARSEVINNLTTQTTNEALSANQGRILFEKIKNLNDPFNSQFVDLAAGELTLNFDSYHNTFVKSLTAQDDTTAGQAEDQQVSLNLQNLQLGHRLILVVDANSYNLQLPDFVKVVSGIFDPESNNVIEFEVTDESSTNPEVVAKIFGSPSEMLISVRRLNPAYEGPAFTIRRASDNTTLDVFFLANGDLDEAAITAFATANPNDEVFVTKWFDQSSAGYHLIQPDTNFQPVIYENNAIVTVNGKPAVEFSDGATRRFMYNDLFKFLTRKFTISALFTPTIDHRDNSVQQDPNDSNSFARNFYVVNIGQRVINGNNLSDREKGIGITLQPLNDNLTTQVEKFFADYGKSTLVTVPNGNVVTNNQYFNTSILNNSNSFYISNSSSPIASGADPGDANIFVDRFTVGRQSNTDNNYAQFRLQELRATKQSIAARNRNSFHTNLLTNVKNYFNF